jgi:hypothetical protein
MKRCVIRTFLAVMVLGFASSARADQTYLLSQLLGPSGVDVSIGDKSFYDFSFSTTATDKNGASIAGANASRIFVTFKDPTPDGVYDVQFHSASQFTAQNGGAGLGQLKMKLSFFVSVTAPNWKIDGIDLSRGGVTGGGLLNINETVAYSGPPGGETYLSVSSPGKLVDVGSITPSKYLYVSKGIVLAGNSRGTGSTKFTDFGQSFHQVKVAVPEPASCVLLGVGLLAGGLAWRRKGNA